MKTLSKSKKIKLLKEYFERKGDVLLAFVFGSWAKGRVMEESDFDLGVYLKDVKIEDEVGFQANRILHENIDLVVLNEAPASLISNVLKTGIPLTVKNKKLYWELYLRASSEAEDFLYFLKDFSRIKQKAKSLNIEEEERLRVRIDYLKDELKELDRFKKLTWAEYRDDRDKRKVIERWVETILNATIDIAKLILASEKKEAPRSYEEALLSFATFIGLEFEEAKRFSKLAGLRNILAHEYLDILYSKIQKFLEQAPEFYEKIMAFLENYLEKSEQ